MSIDRTSRLSGVHNKRILGDNGFLPCPKDIIEMMMELIDIDLPKGTKVNIADFVGGLGDQLHTIYSHFTSLELEPVAFYNEMMKKRYEIAKERYGGLQNFHLLNTDLFCMKFRGKRERRTIKGIIPLMYANPPYFDMEWKGRTERSENIFFDKFQEYNCEGGVLLYVVRQPQLASQSELMRKITYRYENIQIFKFPTIQELADNQNLSRKEYIKQVTKSMGIEVSKIADFDQIVVIGQKKKRFFPEFELADMWIERLKNNKIQKINEYLASGGKPVVQINEEVIKYQLDYLYFRDNRTSDITLTKGLNDVLDDLLDGVYGGENNIGLTVLKNKAIIEKTAGNITNEILAGGKDGLLGGLLIKGSTVKTIQVVEEEDEEEGTLTKNYIEKLSPSISALNKEGDSYQQLY